MHAIYRAKRENTYMERKVSMEETKNKLHIVMLPWLAHGHMIPFLELAKLMAQKGHKISYISTPNNIQCLPKLPQNLAHLIDMVSLPLPRHEQLPANAENTKDVPFDKVRYLKIVYDGLKESVKNFLESSRPDWIVYDFAAYWLPQIAGELSVSRAFFSLFTASCTCFSEPTVSGYDSVSLSKAEDITGTPPWIPSSCKARIRIFEAKKIFAYLVTDYSSGVTDSIRIKLAIKGSDAIIIRSCREFEAEWLNLLGDLHRKPVLPVGLLPPLAVKFDEEDDNWRRIREWLDSREAESVVYVALGTEVTLTQEELNELALGIELSDLHFFWVIRDENGATPLNLPDGLEERIKNRGIIWRTWAPQLRILGHKSIGGFMTHCGWNSIIEGLQHGKPLIMLPFMIEQGLNARYFEEKKVGIEMPRDEDDGSLISTEVAKNLRLVMLDDEGKIYRDTAKEMMKIFGNKDLNDQYVDDLLDYFKHHESREVAEAINSI